MGLSSKQVSSDGLDWTQNLLQELPKPPLRRQQQQNQQQQSEPLKCPRCDSANTKFCYYNNYNKSQPLHFCRTCKRHWTKGGTLRNVPVGGGRKNKRIKKATAAASASTAATTSNTLEAIQGQHQRQTLPVPLGDQRSCMSEILYQSLLRPPSSLPQKNLINSGNNNSNICLGSTLPLSVDQNIQFPFSSSSSFNTNPFSVSASFPSSNVYNYSEEINTKEVQEPTITSIMANTSSTATQPWQIPTTTSGMDISTYWNWDDIDPFASTDLNLPWDDSEIKP
jgi:hypothetical protein